MQKKVNKFLALGVLVCGIVLLAGCGSGSDQSGATNTPPVVKSNKKPADNGSGANSTDTGANTTTSDTTNLPAPPAPTGKIDDTVNAIEKGSDTEGTQATSDEGDAKAATDNTSNSQAVNDLGAGL